MRYANTDLSEEKGPVLLAEVEHKEHVERGRESEMICFRSTRGRVSGGRAEQWTATPAVECKRRERYLTNE
ncbi:hypothetical protein J6590_008397 [Homalodisca vitripennis]|nr:hypothetical protein J6590_008397 [Homalodisca vitripennis]